MTSSSVGCISRTGPHRRRTGRRLQWHLVAMWLLMINGPVLCSAIATGRFRRKLFPIWPRGLHLDRARCIALQSRP